MQIENLYELPPYSLDHAEKEKVFKDGLIDLTEYHRSNCPEYDNILKFSGYERSGVKTTEDIPFIPVRIFKNFELMSCPREEIVKTMHSSGTTGQAVSQIFLNKENVQRQTKVLAKIITSFIGKQRLPLLMLDTAHIIKDRSMYSARGAGIVGFSTFGRDVTYALDENMEIDIPKIREFLKRHSGETVLMFGYTYMIWQYVIKALEEAGDTLNIDSGILFHIGGWKKLKDQAVETAEYNRRLNGALGGNTKIYNYYGMAEQLGSVFVECEYGHMHCSNYSDVIIRRAEDFSAAGFNEKGLIELISLLPVSYPGHALLTEDEGEILGEDDCPCGRKGKYFKIHGRAAGAELRGCSDTYERR